MTAEPGAACCPEEKPVQRQLGVTGNLTGLNSFKTLPQPDAMVGQVEVELHSALRYSGLAAKQVLGLDSKKVGKKDGLDFAPLFCQR